MGKTEKKMSTAFFYETHIEELNEIMFFVFALKTYKMFSVHVNVFVSFTLLSSENILKPTSRWKWKWMKNEWKWKWMSAHGHLQQHFCSSLTAQFSAVSTAPRSRRSPAGWKTDVDSQPSRRVRIRLEKVHCRNTIRTYGELSRCENNRGCTKLRRQRERERQKSNRFNVQNNNFARASRFFVHFFAVLARLRREMTKF